MRAWERAGKYLGNPKRKLSKPAEATELINRLKALREALDDFPRLLGEAGQPGYSVVILARQPAPVPVFQTLLPGQRETLAQHWKGGRQLLQAHREYLRLEIQASRRRGRLGRALRASAPRDQRPCRGCAAARAGPVRHRRGHLEAVRPFRLLTGPSRHRLPIDVHRPHVQLRVQHHQVGPLARRDAADVVLPAGDAGRRQLAMRTTSTSGTPVSRWKVRTHSSMPTTPDASALPSGIRPTPSRRRIGSPPSSGPKT